MILNRTLRDKSMGNSIFPDRNSHHQRKKLILLGEFSMKKQSEELFKIGEIAKILGVTRKAILVYEEMGLLTPAVKDEASGYRYYTADNMTQIRAIRSLQTLGLSAGGNQRILL